MDSSASGSLSNLYKLYSKRISKNNRVHTYTQRKVRQTNGEERHMREKEIHMDRETRKGHIRDKQLEETEGEFKKSDVN